MHDPETVAAIAARIRDTHPEDAQSLLWCAAQFRRVTRALDEIVADAMEDAQAAEDAASKVVPMRRRS